MARDPFLGLPRLTPVISDCGIVALLLRDTYGVLKEVTETVLKVNPLIAPEEHGGVQFLKKKNKNKTPESSMRQIRYPAIWPNVVCSDAIWPNT